MRFPDGKPKAVTFSYDDGIKADLKNAEILDKYKMRGTFNLTNAIGIENHLSEDDIKDLYGRGHEIALHCANHRAPGQ